MKRCDTLLYEYAVGLLARREYSVQGLRRKLVERIQKKHTGDDIDPTAVIEEVIHKLMTQRYLSDERYVGQWIRSHRHRYGSMKMLHELSRQGISRSFVEEICPSLGDEDLAYAWQVWQKKFTQLPQDIKEKGKQQRFLAQRGFSFDTIERLFRRIEAGDFEIEPLNDVTEL